MQQESRLPSASARRASSLRATRNRVKLSPAATSNSTLAHCRATWAARTVPRTPTRRASYPWPTAHHLSVDQPHECGDWARTAVLFVAGGVVGRQSCSTWRWVHNGRSAVDYL